MATEETLKPPRKYWVGTAMSAAFVLFGLVAVLGILFQDPAVINAQLGITPNILFWLLLGAAILGEVGGVLGLFMRRAWATPAFGLSVVFTFMYYGYVLSENGWKGPYAGPVVITALHVALLWFAVVSARRGWVRRYETSKE
jgi:hypothetical protein